MRSGKTTLNNEQKLYIITEGEGYSCWGYENAFLETKALAARLTYRLEPKPEDYGTLRVVELHDQLIKYIRENHIDLGTWFNPKTPEDIRQVLETARNKKTVVRLFYGDPDTGTSWLDEYDVLGTIGRSTGYLKIPLLIEKGEDGGPGILDNCLIRIVKVKTGEDLYRHPRYNVPKITVLRPRPLQGWRVMIGGGLHARFDNERQVRAWFKKMYLDMPPVSSK